MTITLKKEVEEQIELPIPCFFKSKDLGNYIGILDENTVVTINSRPGLKQVQNGELWLFKSDIHNAYNNFHSCTETEFLETYDQVVESMYLHPILKP